MQRVHLRHRGEVGNKASAGECGAGYADQVHSNIVSREADARLDRLRNAGCFDSNERYSADNRSP